MEAPPNPQYVYNAELVAITDGDTLAVTIDLGFRMSWTISLRLLGLNAPERLTEAGRKATWAVHEFLGWDKAQSPDHPVRLLVRTEKDRADKYGGRWLATVWRADGVCLNDHLIESGHALAWNGKGAKP